MKGVSRAISSEGQLGDQSYEVLARGQTLRSNVTAEK